MLLSGMHLGAARVGCLATGGPFASQENLSKPPIAARVCQQRCEAYIA